MDNIIENRRSPRIPFQSTVYLRAPGYEGPPMCFGQARDLSLKGFYFHSATVLPEGTACEVQLVLSGSTTELSMRMKGVVVRTDSTGMAVLFQELDIENLLHLGNILCEKKRRPRPTERDGLRGSRTER